MVRRKKASTAQPVLLTIPDVAVQLGVCRNTDYNLIDRRGLPSVLLGGVRRVHPDSLQAWLMQREQQSAYACDGSTSMRKTRRRKNGQGSVYKGKAGRYSGIITLQGH